MGEAAPAFAADDEVYFAAALALAHRELPANAADWLDEVLVPAMADWPGDRRLQVWRAALASLPNIEVTGVEIASAVRFDAAPAAAHAVASTLRAALAALAPWRKGPFELFGLTVDAEWRSDCKWARIAPHLRPLTGRAVLDVGCGNGYYAWRMLGAGARWVLGLDPAPLAVMQFRALQRYAPTLPVAVLPLGSAALDRKLDAFDTVFSLGVLYHRRDPRQHLGELRRALKNGGELVLETLIVRTDDPLIPVDRYARMRNVWMVPSIALVMDWLAECGFVRARCVDISRTTPAEQRSTPWMTFESLEQCLDAADPARTVEGYPAPTRAVFVAAAD